MKKFILMTLTCVALLLCLSSSKASATTVDPWIHILLEWHGTEFGCIPCTTCERHCRFELIIGGVGTQTPMPSQDMPTGAITFVLKNSSWNPTNGDEQPFGGQSISGNSDPSILQFDNGSINAPIYAPQQTIKYSVLWGGYIGYFLAQ
jgi:hypothetical protein